MNLGVFLICAAGLQLIIIEYVDCNLKVKLSQKARIKVSRQLNRSV